MDFVFSAYFTAFVLGAVHAIEVDHMVAVTVFTGLKPRIKAAASYGARWGIGHALVVVAAGGFLAWCEVKVPASVANWGEALVGVALIGLGVWALRRTRQFHAHKPVEHDHSQSNVLRHGHLHAHAASHHHHHSHNTDPHKHHQHLPTAMGALHGLAGSAPVLALIPVTLLNSVEQAVVYLLMFSIGTQLSMFVYAMLAAAAMQSIGITQRRVKLLTTIISSVTIIVGGWWITNAVL